MIFAKHNRDVSPQTLFKRSHLARRYRSGSSVVLAWKTEENWVENIQKIKTRINKIYKFTVKHNFITYNTIQYNTIN